MTFAVDLSKTLEKNGFKINSNANLICGRILTEQDALYQNHEITVAFVIHIEKLDIIEKATFNIKSIKYNKSDWKEFNETVTSKLETCCTQLKGQQLPRGKIYKV